ncbi:triacylglycerol lipase 2-like [Primulina eburnea]|uniref:triacylglycerol lipase 2-like n=1 Tax=Primulina eburnea TaxID=1245227 RepID=UPI003C6CBD1D
MTKTIATIVLLCFFNFLVADGRNILSLKNTAPTVDSADGICKSMVDTQHYSCQDHTVTTKDGYILSIIRIGMSAGINEGKTPVLLQHGILSDALTWISDSPDESLGFILADNGLDVWLANVRGTNYSRGHISLSPDDSAYWDWSWDELAAYDLPAMVQYVYGQTGQKLHYVGHSLGTLMALGAFSRGEVVSMVRSAALLCPIAYLGQMPSPLARAAADLFIAEALYWLGLNEFAPGGGPASKLVHDICSNSGIDCSKLDDVITGPNCCLNSSKSYLDDQQPTSTKNMVHLAQMIRQGNIAMYDYGSEDANNKHYGQPTPPEYNMTQIPNDMPLLLSYGGKDLISDVKDVQTLIDELGDRDPSNLALVYREKYSHLDFVHAINAKQVVYNPIMDFFNLH